MKNKVDANVNKSSFKKKMIIIIEKCTDQSASKKQFSGFLFTPWWIIIQVSLKKNIANTFIIKVFAIFEMRLFLYKHNKEEKKVESKAIKFGNCDRSTGLLLNVKTVK